MDFNNDGKPDIISGSYSPGELYFFKANGDGTFAAGEKVNGKDGKPMLIGESATAPVAVDWDNDKDLDLVVGTIDGNVWLVVNEGSADKPEYGTKVKLAAAGKPIQVSGGTCGPAVADWNGDGLPDLLIGSGMGNVVLYAATGRESDGKLKLGPERSLVSASMSHQQGGEGQQQVSVGTRLKLCVTDFNGDGKLDLLVGDFASTAVAASEKPLSAEEQKQKAEAEKQYQAVMTEYRKLIQEVAGDPPKDRQKMTEWQQQMQEKMQSDPKIKAYMPKLQEAMKARQKFQPQQRNYQGNVWFFARNAK